MIYFLTGFMGAGKSSTGKELAALVEYPFVDLDKEIEHACGKAVQDIFEGEGESFFREKEAQILRTIPDQYTNAIVACGGGTPCFHDNMEWMNAQGETWYLKISVAELLRRLSPEQLSERPLIKGARPEELRRILEDLLLKREKFYMKAYRVISEENTHARFLARYFE